MSTYKKLTITIPVLHVTVLSLSAFYFCVEMENHSLNKVLLHMISSHGAVSQVQIFGYYPGAISVHKAINRLLFERGDSEFRNILLNTCKVKKD